MFYPSSMLHLHYNATFYSPLPAAYTVEQVVVKQLHQTAIHFKVYI